MNFFYTKSNFQPESSSKNSQSKNSKIIEKSSTEKAQAHRDKLLNFDSSHAKRTTVVDSQQDYYKSANSDWLDEKEKKLHQKAAAEEYKNKHKSRLDHSITLDLLGQSVIDDEDAEEQSRALANRLQEELNIEKQQRKAIE